MCERLQFDALWLQRRGPGQLARSCEGDVFGWVGGRAIGLFTDDMSGLINC